MATKKTQSRVEMYALRHPVTGEVRYIGKANDSALRLKHHISESRRFSRPVHCWIRKLASEGLEPVSTVECVALSGDWQLLERQLIAQHRQELTRLLNVADGGDEPHCTLDVRVKNAKALQSHPNTVAQRRLNGAALSNKLHSDPVFAAIRRVMQRLGSNAKYIESLGKHEKAAQMRQTLAKFKVAVQRDRDAVFYTLLQKEMFRNMMGVELV